VVAAIDRVTSSKAKENSDCRLQPQAHYTTHHAGPSGAASLASYEVPAGIALAAVPTARGMPAAAAKLATPCCSIRALQ
jgi:hypothetical protein